MSPAALPRGTPAEKAGEKQQGKEWKASSRHPSGGGGAVPAHAYNPKSGTFHLVDIAAPDNGLSIPNSRFRSIDEMDDNASAVGSCIEHDSMSNNGSCSGESEDQSQIHGKDKNGAARLGTPPGLVGAGSEKRDKIRWKNERKHQRQKERRAQELKDRSINHLMSRKLEALSQQLVAMGFSAEQATMALIQNEGNVERSVSWILEGCEGHVKEDIEGDLKIDIVDELARISELEICHKFSRPDIERAIIACQGDLDRASEWLRDRHPHPSISSEFFGEKERGIEPSPQPTPSIPVLIPPSQLLRGIHAKPSGPYQAVSHTRGEEIQLHRQHIMSQTQHQLVGYPPSCMAAEGTEGGVSMAGSPSIGAGECDSFSPPVRRMTNHGFQVLQYGPPTTSSSPHVAVDSRPPPLPTESRVSYRNPAVEPMRDPIMLPQSALAHPPPNASISTHSASFPPSLSNWKGSIAGTLSPSSSGLYLNGPQGDARFKGRPSGNILVRDVGESSAETVSGQYHPLQFPQLNALTASWNTDRSAFGPLQIPFPSFSSMSNPIAQFTSSLPSTSGLFTGWGSGLSGAPVDWNMGASGSSDYKTIDWSMAASPSGTPDESLWGISSSLATMLNLSDTRDPGLQHGANSISTSSSQSASLLSDGGNSYDLWSGPKLRPGLAALVHQEKSQGESGNAPGLELHYEWTSPFAERITHR